MAQTHGNVSTPAVNALRSKSVTAHDTLHDRPTSTRRNFASFPRQNMYKHESPTPIINDLGTLQILTPAQEGPIYASLAKASYAFEFDKQAPIPVGYHVDRDLSDVNRTVFTQNGKAIVAFRGTDVLNWKDLAADVMLAIGFEGFSTRFRDSVDTTNLAIEKYGKNNVTVTGHSLGGTQALFVNGKTGAKAVAFNPGASIPQAMYGVVSNTVESVFDAKLGDNSYIWTSGIDPISSLSHFENANHFQVGSKTGLLNHHNLDNFLAD